MLRGEQSRAEFAEGMLVPPSSLGRWETGVAYPDLSFVVRLSSAFNVTMEWLTTGIEPKTSGRILADEQLAYLDTLGWPNSADVGENKKNQHTEIIESQEKKTADIGAFEEIRALEKELRTALRDNAGLHRQLADLRVEREQLLHRITTLEAELAQAKASAAPFAATATAAPGAPVGTLPNEETGQLLQNMVPPTRREQRTSAKFHPTK